MIFHPPSKMKRAERAIRHPIRTFVYAVRDWADARILQWRRTEWEATLITPTDQPGRSPGCDPGCEYCGYLCRCGRPW